MEVNKFTDIIGTTAASDMYEGRMVLLDNAGQVKLPSSAAEAALARYVVAWPVHNQDLPMMLQPPTYGWALRQGFDQASNLPATVKLYASYPELSETPQLIPSGYSVLAFAKGEFTVTSGAWVYDATLTVGMELEVNYTGPNAGKLQKKSSGTAVAVVTGLLSGQKLQFRTYGG